MGNSCDSVFPTYENLALLRNPAKLDRILSTLQLSLWKNEGTHWKSVYISSDGASYYLILIIYALLYDGDSIPSLDVLFSLDETYRSREIEEWLEKLRRILINEIEASLKSIDALEDNHPFVGLVKCLLESRLAILRHFK